MPHERNVLLVGFVSQREISVARNVIINFDEVGSVRLDLIHRAARVAGILDDDRTWPYRWVSVNDGAAEDNFRSDRGASKFGSQAWRVFASKHQPHSGHSIGNVKRQVLQVLNVDVHVPKPWNEKLAVGINDAALRCLSGIKRGDRKDAITLNNDSLIRQIFSGCNVHNPRVDKPSDF